MVLGRLCYVFQRPPPGPLAPLVPFFLSALAPPGPSWPSFFGLLWPPPAPPLAPWLPWEPPWSLTWKQTRNCIKKLHEALQSLRCLIKAYNISCGLMEPYKAI